MSDTKQIRKRGGLMTGLVFLALGVFVLLRNLGAIDDPWEFYARYWPALLMLMGLAKILEFWLGSGGRMLRFGEFVLILLVIFSGLLASTLPWRLRLPLGGRRVAVQDYYGSSFTFTEEKVQPLAPNLVLSVKNSQGSVVLVPGIDGQLRIRLQKKVYARSEGEAKKIADKIHLVLSPSADRLHAEVNRGVFDRQEGRFETSFEITVPPNLSTDITNNNGDVSIEGLTGKQTIATSYGRLTLQRLHGDLLVSNKYGDTGINAITGAVVLDAVRSQTTIEDVSGDLTVTNAYASIDASNIRGKVRLNSSYSRVKASDIKQELIIEAPGCQVDVHNIEGPAKIQASHKEVTVEHAASRVEFQQEYGSVRATNIGGELAARLNYSSLTATQVKGALKIDSVNSAVDLEDVRGDAVIHNKYKPVTLNEFSGSVEIVNENSSVSLSTSAPPHKPITVSTSSGTLVLSIPASSSFKLEAQTRGGGLEAEFEGLKPTSTTSESSILAGQVGSGGPLIKLQNQYGDLQIRKSSSK
jgi:DUF4097 and DUF4098 domain-containing protein YvlB